METTYTLNLKKYAYIRWKQFSSDKCKCENHYPENNNICDREHFWRLYCKIRDGKILNDEDKFLLGAH